MEHPLKSLSQTLKIYDPRDVETDKEPTSDNVGLNCINQTPSTHLPVVRCVSPQLVEKNDWRKSVTFHTFTKIVAKNCKLIVDRESCINAISLNLHENLSLEVVPHPTHSRCHGLISRHLRSYNDVLSQSISIITKIRSCMM